MYMNIWRTESATVLFSSPEPISRTDAMVSRVKRNNLLYVVGTGWKGNYVSYSTKSTYATCNQRLKEFKADISRDAKRAGDEIVEYQYIYAEDRQQVKKIFNIK